MLLCKHQTNNQLNKANVSDMLANCYHLADVDKHNHDRHSLIHTSTGGKQEEVFFLVSKTIFFSVFFFFVDAAARRCCSNLLNKLRKKAKGLA